MGDECGATPARLWDRAGWPAPGHCDWPQPPGTRRPERDPEPIRLAVEAAPDTHPSREPENPPDLSRAA